MTDFADRAFQIFIDVDSSELPDAAYWLQARLIDREHPEHGQAVWVLRHLLEWVSADPRNELENRTTHFDEDFDGHESRKDWPVRTLPSASPRMGAGAYRRAVGL